MLQITICPLTQLDHRENCDVHVLPQRAFADGCFEPAAKLLIQNALASKVSPAAGVIDQRQVQADQFFQIEMPEVGISFSGPLTTRDVLASPLSIQTKKAKWILIAISVLVNLFALFTFIFLFNKMPLELGIMLFAFILFLNVQFWRVYRANLNWTKTPDQVLMQSRGVIRTQALYATTPTGASIYRWDIFTEATIQDEIISLALPGKLGHRVILSRRQFASDNDWSQAKEIIRGNGHFFPIIGR